jgi:iron complex outermembrane recepter protein
MRLLIYLILFNTFFAAAQTDSTSVCSLVLSGTIYDLETDEVLSYAAVYHSESGEGTITDVKGAFRLSGLCPGSHTLRIDHIGCPPLTVMYTITSDTSVTLHLQHDLYQLEDLIITDHGNAYQGNQSTAVLEKLDLERSAGDNLGTILEKVPGVWSLKTGPTISKPAIHGLHSNRILIMNNGVRMESQQWGSEHGPEIDPFIADEITVVRGAASVRYGSDALGGVVLLQAPDLPYGDSLQGALFLVGNSNTRGGTVSGNIQGGLERLAPLAWRLQGTWKGGGDTHAPDYVLSNTAYRESGISGALGWMENNWSTELFVSRYQTTLGILAAAHIGNLTDLNVALASDTPLVMRPFSYSISEPRQFIVHQLYKSFTTISTGDIGHLDITIAYQDNLRQEYDQDRNPDDGPSLDFNIGTFTTETVWEHRLSRRFTGSGGISYMNQQNVWSGRYFIPNFRSNSYGLFWTEKWVNGSWTVEGGARYDFRRLESFRNTGTAISTTVRDFSNISWLAGASYNLGEHWKFLLHSGTAWRAPAINELYAAGLHHGAAAIEYGNPDLVQEIGWNNSFAAEYQSNKLFIDAGVFVHSIDNFIYLDPVQPPALTIAGAFPVFEYRQTDALLYGSDVLVRYMFYKEWQVEGRASLLRARDVATDSWIIYMPADRWGASLLYHFHDRADKGWDVSFGMNHVFTQSRFPEGRDYADPPPAYTLAEASIGSEMHFNQLTIHWSITSNNLFNVSYRDYLDRFRYYTDAAGRDVQLRIHIPII